MEQELLTLLKQREEAARHRVEGLRAELAALNERIAAAEEELSDNQLLERSAPGKSNLTPSYPQSRCVDPSHNTTRARTETGEQSHPVCPAGGR
ncbi:hypothetical protein GQF42_35135 [Streptomyces broussonetiae]|uniref:Uncharacterized protein n=1 Tax=Streptomyces broussonetiae TaxID=2686304 RepID=A0A6I6NFV5_9ACTN|nr:hypothetical protein [Streptomyces broussonetiae]QHA07835.1 hypothetical protein GQF42_35135 [Streptomyces broussonetiae]